jgi:hypothetical protein
MPGTTNSSLYLKALQWLRQHPGASNEDLCAALGLHPVLDADLVIAPARRSFEADSGTS